MSDIDRSMIDNISLSYFEKSYQIKNRRNKPLANIHLSLGKTTNPSFGTIYFIHGYGGSPIEPCMKIPMQLALNNGFDVIAIEGIDLSATSGTEKQISAMTLARQKAVVFHSLQFCEKIPEINHNYQVSWVHSMSGRAMADLCVYSPFVRHYFNEHIMANPYFVPPTRVWALYEKIMRTDPSGRTWRTLMHKTSTMYRMINNIKYPYPASLYNLNVPLPKSWKLSPGDVANRMYPSLDGRHITFLLGTGDHMAEYGINRQYYDALPTTNKSLYLIDGADHTFENSQMAYENISQKILTSLKDRYHQNTRQQA